MSSSIRLLILNRNTGHACWAWSMAAGLSEILLPQQTPDLSA